MDCSFIYINDDDEFPCKLCWILPGEKVREIKLLACIISENIGYAYHYICSQIFPNPVRSAWNGEMQDALPRLPAFCMYGMLMHRRVISTSCQFRTKKIITIPLLK